ncbi:MAG TPA: HAD family phosphatase [Flavobacteriia bacterium]|nr:HAD family phosphatase [Flavobacteriia bacterium]
MNNIDTIIFDLGGVLVDWDPKYVYREVFNGDEEKVDWFLNTICTSDWNVEQDAGRTFKEATDFLVNKHPEYEDWIRIYYDRWEDMLLGQIDETVALLEKIKKQGSHQLYALTNWSAEAFPVALQRFDFLQHFEGIVVSGEEKTRKPFSKIYEIILDRYQLKAPSCVFIDDNLENVRGAETIGIKAIHFKNSQQLTAELNLLGVHF